MGGEGVAVTEQTALSLAAVQACVRVIAESVATMPLRFYRDDFGNKTPDNAHPLSYLINEPNPMQSRFDFISWTVSQLKMGGNAYLRIHRDPITQRPKMLEPIGYKRVEVKQSPGLNVFYKIEGIDQPVPATEILHFKGLTNGDPLTGISPIRTHAESLGVTIGAQRASSRFYSKNAALKWGIKWQGAPLKPEEAKKLKDTFTETRLPTCCRAATRLLLYLTGRNCSSSTLPQRRLNLSQPAGMVWKISRAFLACRRT